MHFSTEQSEILGRQKFKMEVALKEMKKLASLIVSLLCLCNVLCADPGELKVVFSKIDSGFCLAADGKSVPLIIDPAEAKVVGIAASALAEDVNLVCSIRPQVLSSSKAPKGNFILIGTLGVNRLLNSLVKENKLSANDISGKWEAFKIQLVELSGGQKALVIAGNNRRGTAFGVFELSRMLGVSPWVWWADVIPETHNAIYIESGSAIVQSPSIKYRGIFINDEDWGLKPWAAKTYEKDPADIGPGTYAKVFELLLRLKGNFCWPAMHNCTKAFNFYPENKVVADNYAIVMGSSHCEPLLRNNVDEWDPETMGEWNYKTNRNTIYNYWEQRVRENAKYENVYTVGMRGVHDSQIEGVSSMEDRVALLQKAIYDQREILSKYVNSNPAEVPQIFCPYKEVLNLYENGLDVPDDVTIVWADDNHGYIRRLSDPQEQKRSGGSGVYYHLSYWGAPADFLWLGSSAPAVTAYEMHKAYAYGADRLWVFNVGDIKPIEKEMTFALEMAWDIDRWTPWNAHKFCADWAGRTFGPDFAGEIGNILTIYYRLASDGRPEHLLKVTFSEKQIDERLNAYQQIAERAEKLKSRMPERLNDAYYQLIYYPIVCAKLINEKIFFDSRSEVLTARKDSAGAEYADKARQAFNRIVELTRIYNEDVADGKWRYMMYFKPNNRPVFWEPQRLVSSNIKHYFSESTVEPPLKLRDGCLYSDCPTMCSVETGGKAVLEFEAETSYRCPMWFLARTPSDKEDSWFVSFNNWSGVVNDNVTGSDWAWIKAGDVSVRKGTNRLTIRQREPNAAIKSVTFTHRTPGQAATNPVASFPAKLFSNKRDSPDMPLAVISGYKDGAVAIKNFSAAPIADGQLKKSPWVEYEADLDAGNYLVSVRCMPTHRIHKGRGVRLAIAAGDNAPVVKDLHAPEWSSQWSANVTRGYSVAETAYHKETAGKTTFRIYILEPGVVLSELNIYKK